VYRDILIRARKDAVHVLFPSIPDSIKQSHSRALNVLTVKRGESRSAWHLRSLCVCGFGIMSLTANKIHRAKLVSMRSGVSEDQSPCTTIIPSTPKTPRKYGVKFCVGVLVAVILLLAFLLSPKIHVSPVYEYPPGRGRTTTDVTQTTLPTPHPPNLPVAIRVIPHTVHPTCGSMIMGDLSTCHFSQTMELDPDFVSQDDSIWITLSRVAFGKLYGQTSSDLRGMELCILTNNPKNSYRVLEFLEDEPEEELP
jgi:hypothetical protein